MQQCLRTAVGTLCHLLLLWWGWQVAQVSEYVRQRWACSSRSEGKPISVGEALGKNLEDTDRGCFSSCFRTTGTEMAAPCSHTDGF